MGVNMSDLKLLLTAFRGSSAEQLIKYANKFDTLNLPNDKVKDSEKLISIMSSGKYHYVFSFGQRPNIKNKVHIETTAMNGEDYIKTKFDCEQLYELFQANGITAKISHNAGTSFCNCLYYNGLAYIQKKQLQTKMVFLHIPFLKNIDDTELFFIKLINIVEKIGRYNDNVNFR